MSSEKGVEDIRLFHVRALPFRSINGASSHKTMVAHTCPAAVVTGICSTLANHRNCTPEVTVPLHRRLAS